jgi:murein DD-endopeptidase MepM/ murein hydrolase activator NlpD
VTSLFAALLLIGPAVASAAAQPAISHQAQPAITPQIVPDMTLAGRGLPEDLARAARAKPPRTVGTRKRPFVVCPVDRPREYTDDFGASRYVGGFHFHTANDITAPYGTKVRAPFDGRAERSWNPLGGLTVKIYGRFGYAVSAHLADTAKLGTVKAGDVVGHVGQSGDAENPHDHFEWHPNGGDPVSPYRYLQMVCAAKRPAPEPAPTGPMRPI